MKVSSRYLDRTLKKANIDKQMKSVGLEVIQAKLQEAYSQYYIAKANSKELRHTFLQQMAKAWTEKRNKPKATRYKNMLQTMLYT
jgi:hypothetical protein